MNDFGQPVNPLGEMKNQGRNKRGSLSIYQSGRNLITPSKTMTLDATNVAHISKTKIRHDYPDDGLADTWFTNPPHLLVNKTAGSITPGTTPHTSYAPFNEKITKYYDGTNWIEEINYSFVTTKYIYICTMTIRRAGSRSDTWGGYEVHFDIMTPTSDTLNAGGLGGGPSGYGRYVYWDMYEYDKAGTLVNADDGNFELNTYTKDVYQLEDMKYSWQVNDSCGE